MISKREDNYLILSEIIAMDQCEMMGKEMDLLRDGGMAIEAWEIYPLGSGTGKIGIQVGVSDDRSPLSEEQWIRTCRIYIESLFLAENIPSITF